MPRRSGASTFKSVLGPTKQLEPVVRGDRAAAAIPKHAERQQERELSRRALVEGHARARYYVERQARLRVGDHVHHVEIESEPALGQIGLVRPPDARPREQAVDDDAAL